MMGESFRCWRSELNKKYIQKGLTPFIEFGNITPSQWEELVAQKTSPETLELSAPNTELAKRNKHHHHLGSGGYYTKKEQFRKVDKQAITSRNIDVKNLKVRSRNYICARSIESSGGNLKFDKPETQETVSRILKYAKDKEKRSFNPSRERDKLSLGLGNKEYTGRTRGLGKRATWKQGFEDDRHMYKKHGRDRETNLELQVKALVAKALEEQGLSMEPRILETLLGELALVGSPPKVSSSQGSTAAIAPIDRIREPTSCTLVFLSSRQNIVMEVVTGVAHPPGGLHHNN